MRINELKVGDRVKYQLNHPICGTNHNSTTIEEGEILSIYKDFFQIENRAYYNWQISVKYEDIISKLIDTGCRIGPTAAKMHREIPIDKEDKQLYCYICGKELILPNCVYWSEGRFSCGICPPNKEKPKSFNFEFHVQSLECKSSRSNGRAECKMEGFAILDDKKFQENVVIPYDFNLGDVTLGKTYIVEIKEKK